MSMQDVIRQCQQEQLVDNYVERDVIVSRPLVHQSPITKMNAQFSSIPEFSGAKTTGTGLPR